MKAFFPQDSTIFLYVVALLLFTLVAGFAITKIRTYAWSISLSWIFVAGMTIGAERFTLIQGAGFRMLVIILVMLFAMKSVVNIEAYKGSERGLGFIQWLAFAGWFGMKPKLFERLGRKALPGAKDLIYLGISRLIPGLLLLLLAAYIASAYSGLFYKISFTALALTGISLVLHFGILNISAGFWRLLGVDTRTLFKQPLLSTSLTEFWGKRWNLAFSEMTALAVYRPLKTAFGSTSATVIAFLFSGLLHELAISVPVRQGYGLPMLYFLIHGLLMLVEKKLSRLGYPIGRNVWWGRAWVIFWLVLPLPLLFHKTFIREVIWQMLGN